MKRPKVLLIAEAANPEWVSVPLIGWSLANALRTVADIHLVTQIRNRDAILQAGLTEGTDFSTIDSEPIARPLWRIASALRMGWTMGTALNAISYSYFERKLWEKFGPAIAARDFDIVHRVTPLTQTTPSSIAAKCAQLDVPFVLGPLNGGVPWPKEFDTERRREREWLSYARGAYKILPNRSRMLKASKAIIVGSRYTESEIPSRYRGKCFYVPENAIDPQRFNLVAVQDGKLPLRACFIGRLVPYKGPDMLIEATAPLLREGKMQLDIIGDGPLLSDLVALAKRENVSDTVRFHGWLAHAEVQAVAVQAHILTFPSIREFGGGVVLEAMALGVVPVVVDYAGPGELVSDDVGYKVPIGSRSEIVEGFQAVLTNLARDPSSLARMAELGRSRVNHLFTWEAKAHQIRKVYDWVTGETSTQPDELLVI